jgi:hypothetical protein
MKKFFIIVAAVLVIDWAWGALHVARLIPLWTFLVFNFPFGIPFVRVESHWVGTATSLAIRSSLRTGQ